MEEINVYLDFSGWVKLSPDTKMDSHHSPDAKEITVSEWVKLSEDERSHYHLQSVVDAISEAEIVEYTELTMEEHEI